MASRISLSTSFSGRWSLISWCVRKPRVLPILMSVFSSWRRLATSSSVSAVSSRPNSRISARSLARETFMRSGLALALASPSASASGSPANSASTSEKSSSTDRPLALRRRSLALGCGWRPWRRGLAAALGCRRGAALTGARLCGRLGGGCAGGLSWRTAVRRRPWRGRIFFAVMQQVLELVMGLHGDGGRRKRARWRRRRWARLPAGSLWGQARVKHSCGSQPLRVRVALVWGPGSTGGRGPEVLLSLLPRKPGIIVENGALRQRRTGRPARGSLGADRRCARLPACARHHGAASVSSARRIVGHRRRCQLRCSAVSCSIQHAVEHAAQVAQSAIVVGERVRRRAAARPGRHARNRQRRAQGRPGRAPCSTRWRSSQATARRAARAGRAAARGRRPSRRSHHSLCSRSMHSASVGAGWPGRGALAAARRRLAPRWRWGARRLARRCRPTAPATGPPVPPRGAPPPAAISASIWRFRAPSGSALHSGRALASRRARPSALCQVATLARQLRRVGATAARPARSGARTPSRPGSRTKESGSCSGGRKRKRTLRVSRRMRQRGFERAPRRLRPAASPSKLNTTESVKRNSFCTCSAVHAVPSVATAFAKPSCASATTSM